VSEVAYNPSKEPLRLTVTFATVRPFLTRPLHGQPHEQWPPIIFNMPSPTTPPNALGDYVDSEFRLCCEVTSEQW
jgi:hypothetical protein